MAVKAKVTKDFPIGQNSHKKGEVKTFSDELFAKHSDSLEEVKEGSKKSSRKKEEE